MNSVKRILLAAVAAAVLAGKINCRPQNVIITENVCQSDCIVLQTESEFCSAGEISGNTGCKSAAEENKSIVQAVEKQNVYMIITPEPSATPSAAPSSESQDGQAISPPAESYREYLQMSEAEKDAFAASFGSLGAYFEWLNSGKAAYEEYLDSTSISGEIDVEAPQNIT